MSLKIDLTPVNIDFVFYAGDDSDFKVAFLDESRVPIDMTPYVLEAQIRKSRSSVDRIILEIDRTEVASGVIKVLVPPSITRQLASDSWNKTSQWDLQCTSPLTVTLVQGSIICMQDVTR